MQCDREEGGGKDGEAAGRRGQWDVPELKGRRWWCHLLFTGLERHDTGRDVTTLRSISDLHQQGFMGRATSGWRGQSRGRSPRGGLHTVRLNVRMSATDKLLSRRLPSSLGKRTATNYRKARSTSQLSGSRSLPPARLGLERTGPLAAHPLRPPCRRNIQGPRLQPPALHPRKQPLPGTVKHHSPRF